MASIAIFQQDRIPKKALLTRGYRNANDQRPLNTDRPQNHGNQSTDSPTNKIGHKYRTPQRIVNMDDTQKHINMPETDHYNEPQVYHHIALGCFIALAQAKAQHGTPSAIQSDRQIANENQQLTLWSYAATNVTRAMSTTTSDIPAEQAAVIARLAEKIVDENLPKKLNHQTRDLRTTINHHLEKLAFDRGIGRITEHETEQQ